MPLLIRPCKERAATLYFIRLRLPWERLFSWAAGTGWTSPYPSAAGILEHVEPAQHPYHMQYGELMEQGQIHTHQG